MEPITLIREGKLSEARKALAECVRNLPADTKSRTLLFQVLAYCGEWDKVERHLDLLGTQSPEAEIGVQLYKNLVKAEKSRLGVYHGRQTPDFMSDPFQFCTDLISYREELARGELVKAAKLLADIDGRMPELSGDADGITFSCFCDCDSTFAGLLEVFIHDRYLWCPFASIRELEIQQPKTLLELLWVPARVVTWDGLSSACFLPALYPDSSSHDNDLVRLGRVTEWVDLGEGCYRGLGQHTLQVGEKEKGLLELREVTFISMAKEVQQ